MGYNSKRPQEQESTANMGTHPKWTVLDLEKKRNLAFSGFQM